MKEKFWVRESWYLFLFGKVLFNFMFVTLQVTVSQVLKHNMDSPQSNARRWKFSSWRLIPSLDAHAEKWNEIKTTFSKCVDNSITHDVIEKIGNILSSKWKWGGYFWILSISFPHLIYKWEWDKQPKWHNFLANKLAHILWIPTYRTYTHTYTHELHTFLFNFQSHDLVIFSTPILNPNEISLSKNGLIGKVLTCNDIVMVQVIFSTKLCNLPFMFYRFQSL